jgi:hypothetical protein
MILYFGCWRESGHYLFHPGMRSVRHTDDIKLPWDRYDAVLAPTTQPGGYGNEQKEGICALHHKDGWTALAFWDRSVDSRPGSNSIIFAQEELEFDQMVNLFKTTFPAVYVRCTSKFKLTLVETTEEH